MKNIGMNARERCEQTRWVNTRYKYAVSDNSDTSYYHRYVAGTGTTERMTVCLTAIIIGTMPVIRMKMNSFSGGMNTLPARHILTRHNERCAYQKNLDGYEKTALHSIKICHKIISVKACFVEAVGRLRNEEMVEAGIPRSHSARMVPSFSANASRHSARVVAEPRRVAVLRR